MKKEAALGLFFIMLLFGSMVALAEEESPPLTAPTLSFDPPDLSDALPAPPPDEAGDAADKDKPDEAAKRAQRFQEYKQKLSLRLNAMVAKKQREQACVDASSDMKTLRACFATEMSSARGLHGRKKH